MFEWHKFNELTLEDLYDVLFLRQEVFTVEQKCTENDLDYKDQAAVHLLGRENDKLVAYMRLFMPGTYYPEAACFGRVLTAFSHRGKRLGRQMMDETLKYLKDNKVENVVISAQLYLKKFYEEYGFKAVGDVYDEAGIQHIKMKKGSV